MDSFLAKHLQGVSRTYAILVPMLPDALAEPVGSAYLLLRIVDTIEDDPRLSTDERLRHFALLETALGEDPDAAGALPQPLGNTADERALMRDAPQVLARVRALAPEYRAPVTGCARAMIAGVRRLILRSTERGLAYPAVRNTAELREYCYYVAGVVGEMLCAMMAHFLKLPALERLQEVAVELGIGLQLVNILKDALKDSAQGRRYLPMPVDSPKRAGEESSEPSAAPRPGRRANPKRQRGAPHVAQAEIYKAVLNEARLSLQRGVEFVLALPAGARELRSFCGLPIAWGAMTLARAERDARQAKIGRDAIRSSIEAFGHLASDDHALRQWLSGMLQASPCGVPTAS